METKKRIVIKPFFEPCDLWIGVYIDRKMKAIYICPIPTVGLKIYRTDINTCSQCGGLLQKTAIMDEGWILQWDCVNEDCELFEEPEYIDWPFGDKAMSGRELRDAGYEVY